MFDERSSRQHTFDHGPCHHWVSVPITSFRTSHSNSTSGFDGSLPGKAHFYPPHTRETLQVEIDARKPAILPSNQLHKSSCVESFKAAPETKPELASAVPLGAPCIMPSPHYDELDSKPELAATTAPETEARQSSELQIGDKRQGVSEVGVQTSFKGQEEEYEMANGSLSFESLHQQELENLATEVLPICNVSILNQYYCHCDLN